MTLDEKLTGNLARAAGRRKYFTYPGDARNPHPDGSFLAFCWQAGFHQDIRSIDELVKDWESRQPPSQI